MQSLRYFWLSLVLLAGGLQAADTHPDDYQGRPIARVVFIGNDDVADDLLCQALEMGEGNIFSAQQLELSKAALLETGKFDSVDAQIAESPAGLVITFQFTEKWHVMGVWGLNKPPRSPYACKARFDAQKMGELEGMPIENIRFEGNNTTREIILREELLLREGDLFTSDKMFRSRQSIKNLGLFKIVWARAERGDEGVIVTFTVTEKWYVLPIPTLSRNTDGDVSYGGEVTWDNVFGLNQRAQLEIEQEDQADGETEQRASLDYRIAKIPGTVYGLASGIERTRTLTTSEDDSGNALGEYYDYIDKFYLSGSRWLKRTAPSQGWIAGLGIIWSREYDIAANGDPTLEDDYRVVNFAANIGYTAINDFEYYRTGQEFGGGIGVGRQNLGSSEDYSNIGAYWRIYQPIHVPVWSNINIQMRAGYNQGQDDVFELGSGSTMRGILDDNKAVGDVFAVTNINWLIPIPRYPAFRWNIFTDIGNAWDRDKIDLLDWKYTVGVGARWKIRALVNISLRVDIGYSPDTGEYKAYVGTNNMF
jgi:outer membrane protein assembly factor BamA